MKENNPMVNTETIEKMKNTINKKIEQGWIHRGRFKKGMIGTNTNKKFTEEHKIKIRISNAKTVKESGGPTVGKNEKQILDLMEREIFFGRLKIQITTW